MPRAYALNEAGRETASMGIAVGDYENNGQLAIFNTTFSDDYKPLYRNEGDANFTDISYQLGIAEVSVPFLGWGDAFLDYDNDGWKDLLMVDGHVYPQVDKHQWGTSWAQRPMLFHNLGGKKFEAVPGGRGHGAGGCDCRRAAWRGRPVQRRQARRGDQRRRRASGAAAQREPGPQSLAGVEAGGRSKSPRDAVGATVYVTANGMKQRGDVMSGGSYISSTIRGRTLGWGRRRSVDEIEVHWPSGKVEQLPGVDRIVR
jgi:hypothetical protein